MEAAVQEAKDQAELNDLLVWAAARGLLADAMEIIARGGEPGYTDKKQRSPAHYAAAHGHLDVLQYLAAKGGDLDREDPGARSPLHYAALSSSVEVLRFLIERSIWLDVADASEDTPLHLAARRGWLPGVQLLLAGKAAVDQPNKRGLSALGEALAGGHRDTARALIEAGADVAWRTDGFTLLHVAAGLGQAQSLQLLLQQPAAAALVNDAVNKDEATPLHAAAIAGSAACVQLLLKHGAAAGKPGAQGLLPWQLVAPAGDGDAQLQQLQQQLKAAAGTANGVGGNAGTAAAAAASRARKAAPQQQPSSNGDAAAGGAQSPVAAYAARFVQLSPSEQGRKVDTLAGLRPEELSQLDFLSGAAKAAVTEVRRAQQLMAAYRAVAALRCDESFQDDAREPGVVAALEDMGRHGNMDKYRGDRAVVSVANKLKKFHAVLQEAGGVRIGLQELLVQPGQSLEQLMEADAQQVQGLARAAAAARAAAVAAIAGPGVAGGAALQQAEAAATAGGTTAASGDASWKQLAPPVARPAGASQEIEAAAPAAGDADVPTDLDEALQQHRQQQGKQRRQQGEAAPPAGLLPDDMPFWQRLKYELVTSFLRALRIFLIMCLIWAVMWGVGLLPGQQDLGPLEAGRAPPAAGDLTAGAEFDEDAGEL